MATGPPTRPTRRPTLPALVSDPAFLAAAIPAVVLMGLSKGGFSGLSVLATPLLALVVPPAAAAALLLPILMVQDAVSVLAYRRAFDRRTLLVMLPGSAIGSLLAFAFAAQVSDAAIRLAIGLIALAFAANQWRRRAVPPATRPPGAAPGVFWGAVSGFTSFVSHAGGPPYQVYVLPQRLAPAVYAGTATMFFAATNALKVWPYASMGLFRRDALETSAALVPLAVAATLAGIWLVRRVPAERFYALVLGLTLLVGLKLSWDGARGLLG